MDSQIEEVKSKLNIVDIVGGYVKLTKTGINYRGVCPFHQEKTPSFFVSPTRQMWHCFGCGAGSSIFDFVMKIEGVEFGDALRILAAKAGVELKRENKELRTERQRLYEICELACLFFEKQLEASSVGKEARDYLLTRGITEDGLKTWRVGYSPDTWSGLTDFLIGKGYKREEIIKAGLAIEKENKKGESYDRFRGRIIFPVFDPNSQVIGFGGRVFKQVGEEKTAKYINTPQTLLYDKSGTLYGLNNAKVAIRKQNQCVVTEGYTDAIMCHQAGFENTVAASGTALTSRHLGILKRYSDNLVLAFDMDVAGDSATKRGINLAQEQGFNIKIVESYLKDSDPADIIAKDPKIWETAVNQARSIMDYYFDSAFAAFDKNTPEGKREIGKIVLPAIKILPNKIEQSHWIQKLAQALGVKEEVILEELAKVKISERDPVDRAVGNNNLSGTPSAHVSGQSVDGKENFGGRKKLLEEKIVSLVLRNPDYAVLIKDEHFSHFSEKIRQFLERVKSFTILPSDASVEQGEKNVFREIFDKALPGDDAEKTAEFKNFLAALALRAENEYKEDGEEEVHLCLMELINIELKNKLGKIAEEIKKAEGENNHQKTVALIEEFNKLTKES